MRPRLDPSVAQQIRYLLGKSHQPRVSLEKSVIPGAGLGVYYAEQRQFETNLDMPRRIVCLYPGIYTPGMPMTNLINNDEVPNQYLAKEMPPSGITFEENAYVINLQDCGGYIDGCALMDNNGRRLDDSPSAVGHLVNHSGTNPNVELISFYWEDVNGSRTQPADSLLPLPNCIRADGSAWYFDSVAENIVNFPTCSGAKQSNNLLCGAALALSEPVAYGDELLLDYGLHSPLPGWAKGWYKTKG